MLASAADCGLALTWHWVFIVLTCSGRKHYLKIVMKIESKPNNGTKTTPKTLLHTLQPRLIVKAVCEVYIVGAVTKIYMCPGCTFNEGRHLKTRVLLSIS